MHTEVHSESGRVIVISDIPDNEPQAFTVAIKNPADWQEMHDYIINENEIDGIPNRRIDCTAEMPFSTKRAVYQISVEEAEVLRQHPKVEWVEESSTHNPTCLEQRKYDEEFDRHVDIFRFKNSGIRHIRAGGDPTPVDNSLLDFTQWGLHRHGYKNDPFRSETDVSADIKYQFTGKNVDVVIMDTGIRWDHPDFLKPGVTSFVDKNSTRVRDILLHGPEEAGTYTWEDFGLTPPGSSPYTDYTVANVLESSSFNGSWHGSHVGGTAAGNQFGAAFEANIWTIACVDRSDVGWSEPSDGFDYIKVWHKNKPINPETGKRNPTIVNCSWGHRQFIRTDLSSQATFRGTTYTDGGDFYLNEAYNAIYYLDYTTSQYKGFTTRRVSGQTTMNELLDDPDCQDIVFICSAGNSDHKQDTIGGVDYNNQFTSGTLYYSSGYDNYFHRGGTPAVGHEGEPDAVISVAALAEFYSSSQETLDSYTNRGPRTDVTAAGGDVLSPWSSGYFDPRDFDFFINYLQGTSMAAPNVTGVVALYLQSKPNATRIDARNWLLEHGTTIAPLIDSEPDFTQSNYWGSTTALRDTIPRVLFNPFANNERISLAPGVEQIIREDLVLELDGRNHSSNTTSWYNSAKNTHHVTLTSGVTYDGYGYVFSNGNYGSFAKTSDFESIGEFTFEAWFYMTSTPSAVCPSALLSSWGNKFIFYLSSNGRFTYELDGGSGAGGATYTNPTATSLNTWHHIVVTRSGNQISCYLDNVKDGTTEIYSPNISASLSDVLVGSYNACSSYSFTGTIGALRFYRRAFTDADVEKNYTEQLPTFGLAEKPSISFGNSDPSTDASLTGITTTGLVMHIDGPTKFDTDLSGNENVPTYYSDNPYNGLSYLNYQGPISGGGSGGGLLNNSVNITGGSFAIEAWIYLLGNANAGGYGQIVCQDDGGSGGQGWQWRIGDSPDYYQDFVYWTSSSRGSAVDLGNAATSIPRNVWSHVAVTYDGTDIRMYLNGVQDFIHTPASSLYGSTAEIGIGRFAGSTYASNYRLNARYGAVRLYNQFLTGDQIKSHYDLQKYRFIPQSLTLSYE